MRGFWHFLSAPLSAVPPMKSLTRHLTFQLPERMGFLNITEEVRQLVQESGVQEGLVLVNA